MLKRKEADSGHCCKHPYTSLGIEQIVQLSDDLFVVSETFGSILRNTLD